MGGRWRDRGEGAVSYIGVALLMATVAAVLATSGVGGTIAGGVEGAVCAVGQGEDCDSDPGTDQGAEPPGEQEWGGRTIDIKGPPPDPTGAERKAGQEAAERIRDTWGADCAWYRPWSCDPVDPAHVLSDMSPGEINALFEELGDEEVRNLLEQDGVVDVLMVRADPSRLLHLNRILPGSIEPDFTGVRVNGEKPSEPATGYGAIPNAELFGDGGRPWLEDIDQGTIGDCWWLVGLGALADTPEGRARIKDMIVQNPNGTYTVTFPGGREVTVTPYVPIDEQGDPVYAQPTGVPPVIWPLIMEKALAKAEGGYAGLVAGGEGDESMDILAGGGSGSVAASAITRRWLENRLDQGTALTVSSLDHVDGKEIYEGDGSRLVADHAYVVQDVTEDGEVKLYNPWGDHHATLTMREFRRYLQEVDYNALR